MDLELGLADRKHVALRVCGEECRECVEFPTLDVDVEGVDERVSRVPLVFRDWGKENTVQALLTSMSEPSQAPILGVVVVVIARPAECVGFEMNPLPQLQIADGLGYSARPKLGMSTCNSVGIRW